MMTNTEDKSTYWAIDEPDALVDSLQRRWDDYVKYIRQSVYYKRIMRSLRYYHNLFYAEQGSGNREINLVGEDSNMIATGVGHFRSLLDHIFQFAAGDRLALKGRAVNTDTKSMQQARLATGIIDYYQRERSMEEKLRVAAVHALVFGQGFVEHTWDPDAGDAPPPQQQDPMMGLQNGGPPMDFNAPQFGGDVVLETPTVLDVGWNCVRPWEEKSWVIVRKYKNRYDEATKFPHLEEELVGFSEDKSNLLNFYRGLPEEIDKDQIPVFEFFHARTPAVPSGRYMRWITGQWLLDTELSYKEIPLSRISAGEWVGQGTGWTPAFSLQAPQEMHNQEVSSIITNHAAFASQGVYVPPGGEKIKVAQPKKGPRIYSGPIEPKPMNFLVPSPELHKMEDRLVAQMQLISGVSGATRGVPEAGVTAGNALALLDAKSVQANSTFVYSYQRLGEQVATAIIRMFNKFSTTKRSITTLGISNMPYLQSFSGPDLDQVDRVVVESVNPMTKTLAGKDAKAKDLIAIGAIRNVEQYNQVYETGNLDPMFEAERAQINVIRQENEMMALGQVPPVLEIDNHSLHIREHQAVLATMEARANPGIIAAVLGHNAAHVEKSMTPGSQIHQSIMGYQNISGLVMGAGMPGTTQTLGGEPPTTKTGGGTKEPKPAGPAEPNPMAPQQVPVPNQPPA